MVGCRSVLVVVVVVVFGAAMVVVVVAGGVLGVNWLLNVVWLSLELTGCCRRAVDEGPSGVIG